MTEPSTQLPRLAPGTYQLTKRVIVNAEGLSEFVDEPVGEYIKGFWPRTRTRVTPVLDEETPLRERVRRAVEQALIGADMVDGDVEKITFGTADSRAVADEVLAIVGPELERLGAEARVVRDQLLAALPDEWDTGEPSLAAVADAVRHKLERRTQDCVRVLEALLPILRAHSLSKDEVEGDNLRAGDVAESAAGVLRWQQDRIEKLGDEVADARSDVAARSIVLPADWKAMLQQLVAGHSQTITDTRPKRRWWSRRQTGSAAALDIAGDVAALVEDWVTAAVSEAWEAGRG